ncbi:tyrosine phosphatase family protein [Pedosphaera parvula]|nr:protein-tyrosine-phosphatase [Pedosphaera parvula]
MPYRISICGKQGVDSFSRQGVTHLLSIEDPSVPKDTPSWFSGPHEQVRFHDVESVREAEAMRAVAPTKEDVAAILNFGEVCYNASENGRVHLLIHCFAGACRSTAAAYALICQAMGPGCAREALEHVLSVRPEAFPNYLVVKHADLSLQRGGEMLQALGPLRSQFKKIVDEWAEDPDFAGEES